MRYPLLRMSWGWVSLECLEQWVMVLDGGRDVGYKLLYHKGLKWTEQTRYRHVRIYLESYHTSLRTRDATSIQSQTKA
jgi:hypothetical protein